MLVQMERREQEARDHIRDLQSGNFLSRQIAKLVFVNNSHGTVSIFPTYFRAKHEGQQRPWTGRAISAGPQFQR